MHSSCFPCWFVPFGLYQIFFLGARPRLSAVGKNYPIRFLLFLLLLLLLYRALFAKKGRRVGGGGEERRVTINTFHRIARQRSRKGDECTRRASLHLRSLPNGVESFHAEGSSSSFTDREPSTFPFARSLRREKFSRCQVKLAFFVSTMEKFHYAVFEQSHRGSRAFTRSFHRRILSSTSSIRILDREVGEDRRDKFR